MAKAASNQHFIFLDGMRGISAVLVGVLHASLALNLQFQPHHASLAVDFFFCLSGFVLALAYDDRLSRGMSQSDYLVRRFIRLYPMIVIGAALGLCAFIASPYATPNTTWLFAISTLLMIPLGIAMRLVAFPLNAPLWSLFFEIVASVTYGLLATWRPSKRLAMGIAAISAAALGLVIWSAGTLEFAGSLKVGGFLQGFVRIAYPFIIGIVIFRTKIYQKLIAVPAWVLALLLAGVLIWPSLQGVGLYDAVVAIAVVPMLVALGAQATVLPIEGGLWSMAGRLSYPFYVIHMPLLRAWAHVSERFIAPGWPSAFLGVGLTLVASYALLVLYDEPLRMVLARRYIRKG